MKKRLFLGMLLSVSVGIISFVFSQFYAGRMVMLSSLSESSETKGINHQSQRPMRSKIFLNRCHFDGGQVSLYWGKF